jgi:hypothetical protein
MSSEIMIYHKSLNVDGKCRSPSLYEDDARALKEIELIENIEKIQAWWRASNKNYSNFFYKLSKLNEYIESENEFDMVNFGITRGRKIYVPERVQRSSPFLMNLPEKFEPGKIPIAFILPYIKDAIGEISHFGLSYLLDIINRRLISGCSYIANHERISRMVYHKCYVSMDMGYPYVKLPDLTLLKLWRLMGYLCLNQTLTSYWIGIEMFQRFPYYPEVKIKNHDKIQDLIKEYPQFSDIVGVRNNISLIARRRIPFIYYVPFFEE